MSDTKEESNNTIGVVRERKDLIERPQDLTSLIQGISSIVFKMRGFLLIILLCHPTWAAETAENHDESPYVTKKDLRYRDDSETLNPYQLERCVLDLYLPKTKGFSTIIWFHGGGLTGGNKSFPSALKNQGHAIVSANYRLSPKATVNNSIDDAAAAVAWVLKNIETFGGNRKRIFVSGHSAGGYLASMIGLDQSRLDKYGVDANDLAGLIPYSGHAITHFTARKEKGIAQERPVIDHLAPLFYVRKTAPPILLITGDREKELLGRYEENAYLLRMLKVVGHQDVSLLELGGYGHNMTEPAHPLLLDFIARINNDQR